MTVTLPDLDDNDETVEDGLKKLMPETRNRQNENVCVCERDRKKVRERKREREKVREKYSLEVYFFSLSYLIPS
jgi:hypothetical protein